MIQSNLGMRGDVSVRRIAAKKAPMSWRIKNAMRRAYLWGWFVNHLAVLFSKWTGVVTLTSQLSIRARIGGEWIDYGVVGYRVITTVGAGAIADDFTDASADVSNFKYHGLGTGNTAEAIGDTALVTESTTALNPDSTRATGTNTNPSTKVYQSVGTLTFDNTAAIVEHGLFSTSGTGTGILFDRTVFSTINMASGDALQATYSLTISDNG